MKINKPTIALFLAPLAISTSVSALSTNGYAKTESEACEIASKHWHSQAYYRCNYIQVNQSTKIYPRNQSTKNIKCVVSAGYECK